MSTNEATAEIIPFTPARDPQPVNVTIKDFLNTVFLGNTDRVWICSVKSEKHSGISHNWGWKGGRVGDVILDTDTGHYYSLGLIKPGAKRKAMSTWDGGTVLVIDDVGEKSCDPALIVARLGSPTFIVQTSPKSQQWGYVFTHEVKDINLIARLQRAATLAFYPSGADPGHEPPVQYLRLPSGVNDKDKHTDNGKKPPPKVTLTTWAPDRKFDPLLDLAVDLGEYWDQTAGTTVSTAPGVGTLTLEQIATYQKTDPVLAGLASLGMVIGPQGQGWIEVTCPWAATHTNQDDRTGYNPLRWDFKCQHSDGLATGKKTRDDVVEWLKNTLGADKAGAIKAKTGKDVDAAVEKQLGEDEWTRVRLEAAKAFFGSHPLPGADNDNGAAAGETASDPVTAALSTALAAAKAAVPKQYQLDLIQLGRGAGKLRPKMPPDMCSLLTRGDVSIIVSQPGVGKSQLAITLAMALASDPQTNPHKLIGDEAKLRFAGSVLIIANEDNYIYTEGRRQAWLEHHGIDPSALVHEVAVNRVAGATAVTRESKGSNVKIADALKAYGKYIMEQRAAGNDHCLVVMDTAATVLENLDENLSSDAAPAYALLAAWATEHNVAILLLHHTNKAAGKDGGDQTAIRGSSAIAGSVRKSFILESLKPKKGAKGREKYVRLRSLKVSHDADPDARVFRTVSKRVNVEDPEDPTLPTTRSYPVLVYDDAATKGLNDVDTDDRLFRGMAIICKAAQEGNPFNPSTHNRTKNRLIDGLTNGLGVTADEAGALIAEYEKRRWIDMAREVPSGGRRGHPRAAVLPTDTGRRFVEERESGAFDAMPGGKVPDTAKAPDTAEPEAPGVAEMQQVPEPAAEGGILPGLGEIDFGTTA